MNGRCDRFYETQGFVKVGEFMAEKGDEKWHGVLLRMDLAEKK